MSHPNQSLNIIVTDDDTSSRFVLRSHLVRDGHSVETAESAQECLEILKTKGCDAFDVVVSDYWMPGGNGLDLLKQVKALDPTLAVLLVTAEGEKAMVAELLRNGACGYLEKPVTGAVLRQWTLRAATATQEQRDLRATAKGASDLGLSQRNLLKDHLRHLDDCIDFFFHSQAEASGDFVSVLPVDDDRNLLLMSDASGHDLQAAYQSSYFHGIARGMVSQGASLDAVFAHFNDLLIDEWNHHGNVRFSLAACGVLIDRRKGALLTVNSGLPSPSLSDSAGMMRTLQESGTGAPLGWFPGVPEPVEVPMESGHLVVWTDGLIDLAQDVNVDPLALTHRLLREDSAPEYYLTRANDDVAAIRLNLGRLANPESAAPRIPLINHRLAGSEIERIDDVQTWVERSLRLGLPEITDQALADVTICAREGLINALKHGCQGRADLSATVQVSVDAEDQNLHLRINDSGEGHDFDLDQHEPAAAADLLTEHRGLVMIKHIPVRTTATRGGACLDMDFVI